MKNAAEFSAAFKEPQSILGLRLFPLSLGRFRLLKHFECPFVDDGEKKVDTETLTKELFFSLVVCALPVEEFNYLMAEQKLERELKRWGKKLKKIVNVKGFNIYESFAAFQKFLDAGSEIPWVVLSEQNDHSSMTHWSTSMESVLRSKVGWTKEEVDEQPLKKAIADFFTYMESEGLVRLYDFETYAAIQDEAKANGDAMEKILTEIGHGITT